MNDLRLRIERAYCEAERDGKQVVQTYRSEWNGEEYIEWFGYELKPVNVCHIYAPQGDYECSEPVLDNDSLMAFAAANPPPQGWWDENFTPFTTDSLSSDSGAIQPQDVHPTAATPEFFDSNTVTARLVLAMPFIMGFLVAAILVAGMVWRF